MIHILQVIVGTFIDIAAILMKGSALYILWSFVGPAAELMALSWTLAIVIVFVAQFLTGKNDDIPAIAPDKFMAYCRHSIFKTIVRCLTFVLLAYLLGLIL